MIQGAAAPTPPGGPVPAVVLTALSLILRRELTELQMSSHQPNCKDQSNLDTIKVTQDVIGYRWKYVRCNPICGLMNKIMYFFLQTQGIQKQKMKCEILKLPPIRPPQGSKPLTQSANSNCIWALKSQVWDLQQQLTEAKTENKLLKKAQQRHMVAQQHFSDPEDRFHQVG